MDVGVIGIGGFAAKVIEQINQHPDLNILHGFHPNQEKAAQWDKNLGTSRIEDLTQNDSIDAIFVLTPTHNHFQYCLQSIESKKHVFVEKPLTHTLADARELSKKLKDKNIHFMVGHSFRRMPWNREIKRIIDRGDIGRIVNISINKSHGAIFDFDDSNWRKDNKAHPEGPLATLGTHYFDLLHYWFGKISWVDALLNNIAKVSSAPDSNAVMMVLENGSTVLLQTNYCQCSEAFVHIYGTEGTIYFDRSELSVRVGRDKARVPTEPKIVQLDGENAIREEVDEFYRSISGNDKIETGMNEGLNCMIVLDSCHKSHLGQRRVLLSEYYDYFEAHQY